MCAEALPWRCHRSLIADALLARGWEVEDDPLGGARRGPTRCPDFARVDGDRVVYDASGEAGRRWAAVARPRSAPSPTADHAGRPRRPASHRRASSTCTSTKSVDGRPERVPLLDDERRHGRDRHGRVRDEVRGERAGGGARAGDLDGADRVERARVRRRARVDRLLGEGVDDRRLAAFEKRRAARRSAAERAAAPASVAIGTIRTGSPVETTPGRAGWSPGSSSSSRPSATGARARPPPPGAARR